MSTCTNLDIKMQLASILSISCNIQHLTQQYSQCKLQRSMIHTRTFHHCWQANMANQKPVHPTTSSSEWQKERLGSRDCPHAWGIAQFAMENNACSWGMTRKALLKEWRERKMYPRLYWKRDCSGIKVSFQHRGSGSPGAGSQKEHRQCWIDKQWARKDVSGDDGCYQWQSEWSCKFWW